MSSDAEEIKGPALATIKRLMKDGASKKVYKFDGIRFGKGVDSYVGTDLEYVFHRIIGDSFKVLQAQQSHTLTSKLLTDIVQRFNYDLRDTDDDSMLLPKSTIVRMARTILDNERKEVGYGPIKLSADAADFLHVFANDYVWSFGVALAYQAYNKHRKTVLLRDIDQAAANMWKMRPGALDACSRECVVRAVKSYQQKKK